MQFEVVLCLERLLADLTLESSSHAMSGQVASEVPLTWEDLRTDSSNGLKGCDTMSTFYLSYLFGAKV